MADVRFIPFDDIKKYASQAAKERVSVKHTASTIWIGVFDPDLVGFGGLIIKGNKARVKGDWIFPANRGKGYGHMMTEFRLAICKKNSKIKIIEAYSLHPHYYESIGWNAVRPYAEGVTIVEKLL